MRIGIISDIHANLPALRAVLEQLDEADCIKILCAGDVVGYGPHPRECIEELDKRRIPTILGNHDHWVASGVREWGISPDARTSLDWTRDVLSEDMLTWLRNRPRTLRYASVSLVHASFAYRPRWAYVIKPLTLRVNFLFQRPAVSFNGHSHLPVLGIHRRGSTPCFAALEETRLETGSRFLVNPGSVGQPRDGDPRAACVVYDIRERRLVPLRAAYDWTRTQVDMRRAELPERLVERLEQGR